MWGDNMSESSLMRVSKRNKEIVQALKIMWEQKSEDDALTEILTFVEPTTVSAALDKALKEKARWLHEIKDEIQ